VIGVGGAPTADCPGSATAPEAGSGHLCLYLSAAGFADTVLAQDPVTTGNGTQYNVAAMTTTTIGDGKVSTMGFQAVVLRSAGTLAAALGSWAVTS
jgi:hypothetical protein